MPVVTTRNLRHSIRLHEYDYSTPGAYFITVVSHGYKCLFGKIIDNKMHICDLGKIVEECWKVLPVHFQNLEVESFVVMPNHIHGIVIIHEDDRRGTIYRAPTTEQFGKPVIGSVPTIIRTYKAAVSRQAKRELGMVNIWQRNYYEHIVRNQVELDDIAKYIDSNPETWADDPEYPQKSPYLKKLPWHSPSHLPPPSTCLRWYARMVGSRCHHLPRQPTTGWHISSD